MELEELKVVGGTEDLGLELSDLGEVGRERSSES